MRVLLLIGLLVSQQIAGQEAVDLPAGVEHVVSGGYWETAELSGRYRIVVLNAGFEHVTPRVYVQWISDPTRTHDMEVMANVLVSELHPSTVSVGLPEPIYSDDGFFMRFESTNPWTLENETLVLRLGLPGEYEVAEPQVR
ncbi:MAG TPA: hypothetical protein VMR74_10835 [Gammaproteobacteria bacterium]|nr:hypothetical protein [Gammaproteobacteria bacterium]